jgi:hypothetical protein
LLLAGPVAGVDGDDPTRVELWASDAGVAVAFAGGTQLAMLKSLTIGWTEDRRLRLDGVDVDGEPMTWEATDEERVTTRWPAARVQWPSGEVWSGATVTGSQFGVRVVHGAKTADLPAAKLQAVGSQRWIVNGSERILASDPRGCGCGGRKRR